MYKASKSQRFKELVEILRKRMQMTEPQFAQVIEMKYGTYRDRMRDPETFRIAELKKIENIGKLYGVSPVSVWFDKLAVQNN